MNVTPARERDRYAMWLLVSALVIGAGVRLWLVVQKPPPALLWDHHEYVSWSAQIHENGLTSLYKRMPPDIPMWRGGRATKVVAPVEITRVCNYPPLATYMFALEGRALLLAQGEFISNTRAARVIYALPSMLAGVLLAAGCFAVVRLRAGRFAAALAASVMFCAPPLVIDSARWGQTDSWVLAPAVWMLWFMMRRRWIAGGVLWGVALGLKTQAILLAPVWLFALIVVGGRRRQLLGILTAGAVLFVTAVPYTFTSGFAWFEKSYLENLLHAYKLTTLKAFNIWYLDLLICENDDATVKLLGLEKDVWGKILLVAGVLLCGWFIARRRSESAEKLLLFAGALLLCAVTLPTRVHERYILLPLPFLICAAAMRKRLWWAVGPLIIAATFQITSMEWMSKGAQGWGYVRVRTYEQYERLRRELPPDQFARLDTPEQMLARQRPRFVEERWASGDPEREWALTIVCLLSAAGCLVLLCRPGGGDRKAGLIGRGT
jgi:hypothetical protein